MKKTIWSLFLLECNIKLYAFDFGNKTAIRSSKVLNEFLYESLVHHSSILASDVDFLEHAKLSIGRRLHFVSKITLSHIKEEEE